MSGSSSKKRKTEDEAREEAYRKMEKEHLKRTRKKTWDDLLQHSFRIDNNLKIKRKLYQNHEDMILKNVKQFLSDERTTLFKVLKGVNLTFDMFLKEIYNISDTETLYKWGKAYIKAKLISKEEIFNLSEEMPFDQIFTKGGEFHDLKGMIESFIPFNQYQDLRITPSVKTILHTSSKYRWLNTEMNHYEGQPPQKVICRMNVQYNFKVEVEWSYAVTHGMTFLIQQQKALDLDSDEAPFFYKHNNESNTVKIIAEWDMVDYDESDHTLTHSLDYFLCNNEVSDENHFLDRTFFTLDRLREFQNQMSILIPKHFALLCGIYFPKTKTSYSKKQEFPFKATNDKIFKPDWFSSELLYHKKGFLKLLDIDNKGVGETLDPSDLLYDLGGRRGLVDVLKVEIKSIEKNGYRLKLDIKPYYSEGDDIVAIDDLPEYMQVEQNWDVFNFSIRFTPNDQQTEEIIFKDIMLKYNVPSAINKKTKILTLMNLKF